MAQQTSHAAVSSEHENQMHNEKEASTLAGSDGGEQSSEKGDIDLEQQEPKQPNVSAACKSSSDKGVQPLDAGIIPRSQARGILGRLCLIPEVQRPLEYSRRSKWTMTLIVALAAATSSTASAIFYPSLATVAVDLHTSQTTANLSIALYLLAMAFTPMWWSAWSETTGRRTIYVMSFFLFVVFAILSAVSVNIAMLNVFRVLTGGAAAAVQSVGAGTVADLWEPKERGKAFGVFYLGPLAGPGIAPIIGGALAQTLGWRSTLWALVVFGGVLLLLIVFCLPETVARRENAQRAKGVKLLKEKFVDPVKTLADLQHPAILITVWAGALGFAVLYVILIAVQANFGGAPYHYDTIIVGVIYISPTLGYAVASQTGGRWIDYLMKRAAKKAGRFDKDGKLIFLPEDRMQENIWIASFLYPLALIWYGWTVEYHVIWIVPCIAMFFFGIGSMLTFSCVTTMLTEFTPKRSTAGVALNNFARMILATIAAVIVQPLIDVMGTGWMCTMIALFALVTGNLAILILKMNSVKWRETMNSKMNPQTATTSK